MLKFILGFLVLANCAMAAYNAGYLGKATPDGHEPARITNQLNAPAIRLVDPLTQAAARPGTVNASLCCEVQHTMRLPAP